MGLIIDIETAPDLEDKAYVAFKSAGLGDKRKAGDNLEADIADKINDKFPLSPLTGKITAIGFMSTHKVDNIQMNEIENLDTVGKAYYKMLSLEDSTEEEMLISAWRIMTEYYNDGHKFVTYNGKTFDMPFMIRRSIMLGISKPMGLPSIDMLTAKFNSNYHLDLFQELHTYDEMKQFKFIAQQEWAYRFGLVTEIKGSHGAECIAMYQIGDWNGIRQHLLADLTKTMLLFKRMRGWLPGNDLE